MYGYFRDELYFIACAHRLAWGFVDQPPLAPFIAWLTLPAGANLYLLRLPVALAAAGTVVVSVLIARELGGNRFAQIMTAVAVALMPAALSMGNTLGTTSLEPLTWTLLVWLTLRQRSGQALRQPSPSSAWLWAAQTAVIAVSAYMKYTVLLLALALLFGLLFSRTGRRAALGLGAAMLASLALLGPNLAWQYAHGFPIVKVLHGDNVLNNHFGNAPDILIGQILLTNLFAAPLWTAGLVLLMKPSFRHARFIAISYAFLLAAALLSNAKSYYIVGIYPALFAAGSVYLERAGNLRWRASAIGAIAASGLLLAPYSMPLMPIGMFIKYTGSHNPPRLTQPLYADQFGWEHLTRVVSQLYHALPEQQRSHTAIVSTTYGGAAAIEFYGKRYGLPPPISGQNSYYYWGTHGYDGSSLLLVGGSQYKLCTLTYQHVRLLAMFDDPYRWAVEQPVPIYLCSGPIYRSFAWNWQHFQWYGARDSFTYGHWTGNDV